MQTNNNEKSLVRKDLGPIVRAQDAKQAAEAAAAVPRPARIDISAAFSAEPTELDFVLPGMLAGTVGALISPGGVGKSMLAMQLSMTVATGKELFELPHPIRTGRAVILAAEDPAEPLQHRLHAIGAHLTPDERELAHENLDILPLLGYGIDVLDDSWFAWVLDQAKGARLMVVDTLRRVHGLNENDSGDMAVLLSRLERVGRETGCSVVFLHHSSKSAALSGQGDAQQASRGSSVLVDNARWQSFLVGMTKDEATQYDVHEDQRSYFVRWGVSKQNYGQPVADIWLRRNKGGVLLPAVLGDGTKRHRSARGEA